MCNESASGHTTNTIFKNSAHEVLKIKQDKDTRHEDIRTSLSRF